MRVPILLSLAALASCLVYPGVTQSQTETLDDDAAALMLTSNCSDAPGQGCRSFQEMVKNHDPDILALAREINTGSEVYVCNSAGAEDKFMVLKYRSPSEFAYRKQAVDSMYHARSYALFQEYKEGVGATSRLVWLDWAKFEQDDLPSAATVEPQATSRPSSAAPEMNIDPSEIVFTYSFSNVEGSTTDYTLQIRKSTKRYLETFEVRAKKYQDTVSGQCRTFRPYRSLPPSMLTMPQPRQPQ